MHTHQNNLWSEKRFAYQMEGAGEISPVGAETIGVAAKTHGLLDGLKQAIVPSSQLVETALNKTVLTGFSALNIALLGGVFASGIYMIVAGKPPPFLQKLTGKES